MAAHRVRPSSPSGPRIYLDAPRASTGTILTSTYDTRYDQRPPRASIGALPPTQFSSRNNSVYETQPVSKRTYHDPAHSGATISRTEYAVRPRKESVSSENRRPISIATKNVSPTRDVFDSPRDMVVYGKASRDDTSRLRPTHTQGSGHHQRHNSATRAETSRYSLAPEAPRVEREYHKRGPYVEKVADSRPIPPVARYAPEPSYEYTGPREQFDRDYPPARPRRESLTRRERPIPVERAVERPASAIGTKFEHVPFRRDTAPPPSASRQLARIEREERKSGFESDPERSREDRPRERPSRHAVNGPVVIQRGDDGYSSARDDYDSRRPSRRPYEDDVSVASSKSRYHDVNRDVDRERERPRRERAREREREREREDETPREREREKDRDKDRDRRERRSSRGGERDYERERERPRPRDYEVVEEEDSQRRLRRQENRDTREESPDRGSGLKTLATAAVGGLAAAGVANFKSRKDEEPSDTDGRKDRKHRRRRSRPEGEHEQEEDPEERRRRRERRAQKEESSGSDTPDERKRPQSRTRRRRDTEDVYGSDRERAQAALAAPLMDRRPSRDDDSNVGRGEAAREAVLDRAQQESPTNNDGRTLSPGEGDDDRPRKVSIVEPTKKEELKPKGILKKARDVPFPEDPNPTREGVAPLKQAGKEGIPEAARWTKVSRILVNPEALERYHERFEERDDYVIVLRVLSREEVMKLAEKTKEIREAREREWQKQVEERKRRRAERGDRDTENEDDFDDANELRRPEPLAIEPPPTQQPADLRQFVAQNSAQQQAQMAYAPPPQPQQGYPAQQQQQAYPPQQSYPPQQGYPSQQLPHEPPRQPTPQMQPQPQQHQQYLPGQWTNPGSARNSGEAIANTAPGQPIPTRHDPGQFDAGSYSQNV